MTMLARLRNRNPIPEDRMTWLGVHRGYRYGTHKGREYAVDLHPSDPEAYVAGADEIVVSRKTTELLDGTPWDTFTHRRGFPVQAGTFATLSARSSRKSDAEQPLRTWDRLADLPAMRRQEPMRLATGQASSVLDHLPSVAASSGTEQEALAGAIDLAERNSRHRQLVEVGGNEPPERSIAGLVAYLNQRGIELELARGRLVARSRTPMRSDLRELIERAEELIVGQLQGKPVLCCQCAEAAVTIVFPSAPACAEHAQ